MQALKTHYSDNIEKYFELYDQWEVAKGKEKARLYLLLIDQAKLNRVIDESRTELKAA